MLGLDLRKPGCQLTSADSSDLNDAGICNVRISKHIHSVNADIYALRGFQENLLGMFELRQFALNDVSDVQHNRASWLGILGDNEKALKSNATADVEASFMFFCFTFSAGTSGKESDAVATTCGFTAISGKVKLIETVVMLPALLLVQHAMKKYL